MTDAIIRAPRFEFGAAVTQLFNLPGGKSYLFRVMGFGTLLLMIALVLLGLPIVKAYVAMFSSMMSLETSGLSEAEEMAAALEVMAPMFAAMGYFSLLYIIQIGLYVSIETALYRNIIRGEDKGFFPLRFGGDEFKVLITRIVVAFILYAVFFAVYIGGIFIGVALGGLASVAGSTALMAVIGILIALIIFAVIGVLIYASIRLAPSAAFAVRDVDFTPVGSWGTMGSYFWPTFGAVLVVGFLGYIAMMIISLLAFGILFYTSGIIPIITKIDQVADVPPDFSSVMEALTSAGFVVPTVIIVAIATFFGFLFLGAIWSIWGYVAKLTARSRVVNS